MSDKEYELELDRAKAEYKDLMERGDEAKGDSWEEYKKTHFTDEELRESKFRTLLLNYYLDWNKDKTVDIEAFDNICDEIIEMFKNLDTYDITPADYFTKKLKPRKLVEA